MQSATSSEPTTVVRQVLQSLVDEGPEVGLQVAAYLDGNLVVDAWAGLADESTRRLVDGDTLFMLSSTTKGITATCAAILADQGKLDYDRPVSCYWPPSVLPRTTSPTTPRRRVGGPVRSSPKPSSAR